MYFKLHFKSLVNYYSPLVSTPSYLTTSSFATLPIKSYATVTLNFQVCLKYFTSFLALCTLQAIFSGWNILCCFFTWKTPTQISRSNSNTFTSKNPSLISSILPFHFVPLMIAALGILLTFQIIIFILTYFFFLHKAADRTHSIMSLVLCCLEYSHLFPPAFEYHTSKNQPSSFPYFFMTIEFIIAIM